MATINPKIKVDWKSLYNRFDANVTSFNCGKLCAPFNNGIPVCCDNNNHIPVLFTRELNWNRTESKQWRKLVPQDQEDKKMVGEIENYVKFCNCNGVARCERNYRSITCRLFPFEPYIQKKMFLGMTYVYRSERDCPLIENKTAPISQRFINQALNIWKELFSGYPGEWELYTEESASLRRRFKRKNRPIKVHIWRALKKFKWSRPIDHTEFKF